MKNTQNTNTNTDTGAYPALPPSTTGEQHRVVRFGLNGWAVSDGRLVVSSCFRTEGGAEEWLAVRLDQEVGR